MSLNIQLSPNPLTPENCNVHFMPCKINHDGAANVAEFFIPNVHNRDLPKNSSGSSELLEASFRGYPLQGIKIEVPTGYRGIVINEIKKPLVDTEERKLQSVKSFSEFTYWKWDDIPTPGNGSIHQLLDWMPISKMIHGKD
nr:EOG090X0IC1 [Simocephalus serrulatus]